MPLLFLVAVFSFFGSFSGFAKSISPLSDVAYSEFVGFCNCLISSSIDDKSPAYYRDTLPGPHPVDKPKNPKLKLTAAIKLGEKTVYFRLSENLARMSKSEKKGSEFSENLKNENYDLFLKWTATSDNYSCLDVNAPKDEYGNKSCGDFNYKVHLILRDRKATTLHEGDFVGYCGC